MRSTAISPRSKFGGNVQGGTEALRFFVSGEREDEMGMLKLPDFEKYDLGSQIRRASVSLTNNIAEGHGRYHYLEQIKFLRWILRAQRSQASNELAPSLAHEARERIAKALKSGSSSR